MPSPYYPFMTLTGRVFPSRAKETKKQKKKITPDLRLVQVYSSVIVAGPILRVLNKLRKTAVLMHYKMPGGHSTTLYTERLRLEVQPFGIPLLAKTVPLLYSFH